MRAGQLTVGRRCTVCTHPDREAIEKALVGNSVPLRAIACQFGIGRTSLRRHRDKHLGPAVAKGKELVEAAQASLVQRVAARVAEQHALEDARSLNVYEQLARIFNAVGKTLDACDRYLTDPNNPDRYDLNPRAHELEVTYLEKVATRDDGTDVVATRKALLSELLPLFMEKADTSVQGVKWRMTDPRRLVLEAARRLEGQQRWLTDLVAKAKGDGEGDLVRSAEWRELRGKIVAAVDGCERCRGRLVEALADAAAEAPEGSPS